MSQPNYPDTEFKVLIEQNNVRTNPASYIPKLKKLLTYFRDNTLIIPGEEPVKTFEGVYAVEEAIEFLGKVNPLHEMKIDVNLSNACRDHVADIGTRGLATHEGSDGKGLVERIEKYCEWDRTCAESIEFGYKNEENIVMNMIIDDGVKERHQRKNLFNSEFNFVGVGVGPHRDYGVVTVINYAGGVYILR